jgi:hypothetical protein
MLTLPLLVVVSVMVVLLFVVLLLTHHTTINSSHVTNGIEWEDWNVTDAPCRRGHRQLTVHWRWRVGRAHEAGTSGHCKRSQSDLPPPPLHDTRLRIR